MSKYFGVRLKDEDVFYLTVIKDTLNQLHPFDFNDSDVIRFCIREIAQKFTDECCEN